LTRVFDNTPQTPQQPPLPNIVPQLMADSFPRTPSGVETRLRTKSRHRKYARALSRTIEPSTWKQRHISLLRIDLNYLRDTPYAEVLEPNIDTAAYSALLATLTDPVSIPHYYHEAPCPRRDGMLRVYSAVQILNDDCWDDMGGGTTTLVIPFLSAVVSFVALHISPVQRVVLKPMRNDQMLAKFALILLPIRIMLLTCPAEPWVWNILTFLPPTGCHVVRSGLAALAMNTPSSLWCVRRRGPHASQKKLPTSSPWRKSLLPGAPHSTIAHQSYLPPTVRGHISYRCRCPEKH
jgi:hypothetical protein